MRKLLFFFALILVVQFDAQAQKRETAGPGFIDSARAVPSQSLAKSKIIPPETEYKLYNPKNVGINKIVPGKGFPKQKYQDVQEKMGKIPAKKPILTFDAATSQSTPTDPTGVAGPNHYVNAWNSAFSIFDKSGNRLVQPASLASIGGEFNEETDGDPIVLYDDSADRFIIMQFSDEEEEGSDTPAGLLIAVSQGPDPVNSGWYTYRFNTNALPDYPKISVWGDGYYITTNKNALSPEGKQIVFVLERDQMLVGNTARIVSFPLPGIRNNGFYSPAGFNAVGNVLPPRGNAPILYFQDDAWAGVNEDHLKIWVINVNWNNLAASTISESQELGAADGVSSFISTFDGGSFENLPQPLEGTDDVDALQGAVMYMTPFRQFSDHNSVVLNFVVDVDPSAAEHAGIRWYELRQQTAGAPWQVYQEGTFAPDNSDRFSGSIGIDAEGNIGLGYTVLNDSPQTPVFPSLRYTGRYADDELGIMTIEEQNIVQGESPNPSFRYGDYGHLSVDAGDEVTFWFNGEYFEGVQRVNKVGVFKLAPDFDNDVGVVDLVAPEDATLGTSEQITVRIRNFGRNAQSNFPVSYTLNGETVTETFTESLPGTSSAEFTFAEPVDLSTVGEEYDFSASTQLDIDEDNTNDTFDGVIRNLPPVDVGVTAIADPTTGQSLRSDEPVTVVIENFGGEMQEDIPVSYQVGNNIPVTEIYAGPLPVGQDRTFTFSQRADLSASGRYRITARTKMEDDFDPLNDVEERLIANLNCIPIGSDCSLGDGIFYFHLGEIRNERIPCGNGYADFIGSSTPLDRSQDSFTVTVKSSYASEEDEQVSMWIDLDDNAFFDEDELVIDSEVIPSADVAHSYDFSLPAEAQLGQHLLRIRAGDTSFDGDLNDPCSVMEYGTTHDYTVSVTDSTLDIEDFLLNDAKLEIISQDQNFFKVVMETNFDEVLRITVHDILGQKLLENRIENNGLGYVYDLDMSYAARGVYLVRVGTRKVGKVKRIIVK